MKTKPIISISFFCFLSLMFFSCNKVVKCDSSIKLEDENTSFLKGEWKWIYTVRKRKYGPDPQVVDTIFYSNSKDNYTLEFTEEGKLIMSINDELYNSYCIYESQKITTTINPDYIHMNLFINNEDEESSLTYLHKKTSGSTWINMKGTEFPYYSYEYEYSNSTEIQTFHTNYFEKQ